MDNFTLDLTKMGGDEAGMKAVAQGFELFCDNGKHVDRYFGYVDKTHLKHLCRAFNYTDRRSFVKGGLVTAGVIGAIVFVDKKVKERREKKANV